MTVMARTRLRSVFSLMIGVVAAIVLVELTLFRPRLDHQPVPDPPADPHYRARLAQILAEDMAAPERAIVLLGDSIIEGLDAVSVATGVLNFGISGDTSGALLDRATRYRSLARAHAIVLEIGINDIVYHSGEKVIANYGRILAVLPKEPRLYLLGILPIEEAAISAAYGKIVSNAEIGHLNAAVGELCQQRGNCVRLQPFGANLRADYHVGDGLHLSEAGYAVLAAALKTAIDQPAR